MKTNARSLGFLGAMLLVIAAGCQGKVDGPGSGVDSKGQWIVGDTVVKTLWKSVTGYGVADALEDDAPSARRGVSRRTSNTSRTASSF